VKAITTACRDRLSSEQAFSIAELLVATLLLFVLTFGIINFADQGTSLAKSSVSSAEVNQEWRETMDAMTRQVRVAYYFESATGTTVSFVSYAKGDNTRYNVAFQLSNGTLQTSVVAMGAGSAIPAKSWATMATGVESLTFTYYDSSGAVLPYPIDATPYPAADDPPKKMQIARVDVNMRIARTNSMAVGTSSEGHRLEQQDTTMRAEGAESVAIRNILTDVP
jgi:hypothetical protein